AGFGRSPASEIVGKTVAELIGPSAYETVQPYFEAGLRGLESTYETNIDRPPGERRGMHVRHMPARNQHGEVRGSFVIATDITELKQAEQALREREERMRAILNTATDGIITFDERGIIVDVNPAAEFMFGYNHGKLT